ncbi:MAG: signal peptidase I [Myxococcota bacterium]
MSRAQPAEAELPQSRKSTFLEILEAVVIALVLAFAIRTFAVQAFKIPSASMIPTLQIGDHILVNKFLFGLQVPFMDDRVFTIRHPRRGDVLVFKFPKDHKTDYIKRLIGEPGSLVEVVGRKIYVNGEVWDDDPGYYERNRRASWSLPGDRGRFGPVYVARKGDVFQLVDGELFVNKERIPLPAGRIIDEGNLRDYYDVFYAGILPPGVGPRAGSTSDPVVVDEDRYFMMGDNRDNSRDGRFWGFVRDSEIRGNAFVIYWSWDRERHRVRWGRLGDPVT